MPYKPSMNQTLISNIVSDIGHNAHHLAPDGFIWQKELDEYDAANDIIWEGNWNLVPIRDVRDAVPSIKKSCKEEKLEKFEKKFDTIEKFDIIEKQRKAISRTLNPSYHICTHVSHESCTKSICCDWFWHDGNCGFVSDIDGKKEGFAVRYGDQ